MRRIVRFTLVLALAAALALAGCSSDEPAEAPSEQPGEPAKITIGTLATQDSLPLWAAEEKGYFSDAGLPEVEIVTFQSAQESQTAFVSGAVDALMTDLIVAANLHASGTPVIVPTVMLGATTEQGRFAIVAAPGSDVTSMSDLAGVPVGTASATITEYILDMLMAEAGVAADVVKEEVQKMPVRFQLLMSGQLAAASLPEPFVTLAELEGASIVPGGDDTMAASNISQSVLCVNKAFADTAEGDAAVAALLEAWDAAVTDINADPDAFRTTLVSKARLPEPLTETYNVSDYPLAAPPAATDVQKVLDWMDEKGYLQAPITPADILP
ncbi:MAG: ABC transporter substrate-binding protein [Anaerosomatales bacterium]|nr:ABC transporter substrate-binding protein [Anaerosomatales bacterium]MDT8434008.1 ABC transporter substrate-binding protein [Anaerosomatales bacterium]